MATRGSQCITPKTYQLVVKIERRESQRYFIQCKLWLIQLNQAPQLKCKLRGFTGGLQLYETGALTAEVWL